VNKFTEREVRYTSKGNTVYAYVMGYNEAPITLTSFGKEDTGEIGDLLGDSRESTVEAKQ